MTTEWRPATIRAAIVRLREETFAVVEVPIAALQPEHRAANRMAMAGWFRRTPTVLMALRGGVGIFYGRRDLVAWLEACDLAELPWADYSR